MMQEPTEVEQAQRHYSRLLSRWFVDPPRTRDDSLELIRQIDRALFDLQQAKYRASHPEERRCKVLP